MLRLSVVCLSALALGACNASASHEPVKGDMKRYPTIEAKNEGDRVNRQLQKENSEAPVSGERLKAFLVAYSSFQREKGIPAGKRKIENYDVVFQEDEKFFTVIFDPHSSATDERVVGGETSLGVEVSYVIRKGDFKLTKREFYK